MDNYLCSICKDTKLVPTIHSLGFGPSNYILETCPHCIEGAFVEETQKFLKKFDHTWSNAIWKRLKQACRYITALETKNRIQRDLFKRILSTTNEQIKDGKIPWKTKTIPISASFFVEMYSIISGEK